MNAIELLLTRQSQANLSAPAPDESALTLILQAGMRVPDHGGLTPWHFTVISGDGLSKLSEIYYQAALSSNMEQAKLDKAQKMPFRAPMIIMVSSRIQTHEKVPAQEQLIAAGCCVHAMQMAAFAQGYGAMWRTGDFSYHAEVKQRLGVPASDEIVGFLYIGTPLKTLPVKPARPLQSYVSYLN